MGKCSVKIDEVRFIIRDPELTHVYVIVREEGDCPIGVAGCHHKAFPSRLSVEEIFNGHFSDFLEWGLEAPPDLEFMVLERLAEIRRNQNELAKYQTDEWTKREADASHKLSLDDLDE